jgi:hypothetical protein
MDNRIFLLTDLETGKLKTKALKSKSKITGCLMRPCFLVRNMAALLLYPHMAEKESRFSYMDSNPVHILMTSSNSSYLLNTSLPNTLTLGGGVSTFEF